MAERDSVELEAPRIPNAAASPHTTTQPDQHLPLVLESAATPDLPRPEQSLSWDESREMVVPILRDAPPQLKRRIRWITIALAASIAMQIGSLVGDRFVPAVAQWMRGHDLADRLEKSARSLESSRKLGLVVPSELEQLQSDAEAAAFAGDVELARRKLEELDRKSRRIE